MSSYYLELLGVVADDLGGRLARGLGAGLGQAVPRHGPLARDVVDLVVRVGVVHALQVDGGDMM